MSLPPQPLTTSTSSTSMSHDRTTKTSSSTNASTSSTGPSTRSHPFIEHVFLAEFDIDQGSILKHQYPHITGVDEHLLAEHMLPDGAHDRQEDWTVFLLNQIPPLTVHSSTTSSPKDSKGKARDSSNSSLASEHEQTGAHRNDLLFVMSLVRTKKDATVRRGALVKALAVASRSPFIQIFKPVLLLALEAYFGEPSASCLARLFHSINSIDLSELPHFSLDERIVLRSSERKDFFENKFIHHHSTSTGGMTTTLMMNGHERSLARSSSNASFPFNTESNSSEGVEELNQAPTPHHHQISHSSSNGSISSIGNNVVGSIHSSSNEEDFASGIYNRSRANTMGSSEEGGGGGGSGGGSSGVRYPTGVTSNSNTTSILFGNGETRAKTPLMMSGLKDTHWFESKITFNLMTIPIRIPLATFPEEVGDYSLIKLIQTFSQPSSLVPSPLHPHLHTSGSQTPPIILLFNALITHKRVVFLGHGQAAAQVANFVLAACALASGSGSILAGFVERTFPYTNLTNLDHLEKVPGFIAGVCNPAFADRPSWWDVLCNIETGKIIISKDILPCPTIRPYRLVTKDLGIDNTVASPSSEEIDTGTGGMAFGGLGGRTPTLGNLQTGLGGAAGVKELGQNPTPQVNKIVESFDHSFMEETLNSIQNHYGESAIRSRFADYVSRFVRLASKYEEETTGTTTIGYPCSNFSPTTGILGGGVFFPDEATALREMTINVGRIEGWRMTESYGLYQQTFATHRESGTMRQFDLSYQISRLRYARKIPSAEIHNIIKTLRDHARDSDDAIVAILSKLPAHHGGLMPLAFGFFHSSPVIRSVTLELFDIINSHPTGHKFVSFLNAFHRSAYQRLSREAETLKNEMESLQLQQTGHSPLIKTNFTSNSRIMTRAGVVPPVPPKE